MGLSNFPTNLDTWTAKVDNVDDVDDDHINKLQDAVDALEIKVGKDSSSTVTTLDYLLKNASSVDPGHHHTASSLDSLPLPAYDLLWVPALAMTSLVTNGAEPGSKEFATNDIMQDYLAFDTSTEEYAAFNVVMPENWDRSTIKAKFYWAPYDDTGSTSDTVEWEIAAGAISNDDAIDAALGTSQVISDTLLAGESGDLHISNATPAITVGGSPALGDLIHFKISRNVAGSDVYAKDALLFGVAIQFGITGTITAW